MKFWKKMLGCSLLWIPILCHGTIDVAALDTSTLDRSKTGSIQLTLNDAENLPVSGGTICLYEVADLSLEDDTLTYVQTEEFCDFSADWDTIDAALAKELAAYVETQGIQGIEATVEADGTVFFDELELGIYLLVQSEESDNYVAITPFLVTVPLDEDGEWVYEIDAAPKVGTVTSSDSEAEDPTEPEETSYSTTTSDTTSETEEPTEPDESSHSTTTSDTTSETEEPTEPDESSHSTDTSSTSNTTETTSVTSTFSNTPSDTPSDTSSGTLPQTGQLNWPIPVLAVAGILLFAFGWMMQREKIEG